MGREIAGSGTVGKWVKVPVPRGVENETERPFQERCNDLIDFHKAASIC